MSILSRFKIFSSYVNKYMNINEMKKLNNNLLKLKSIHKSLIIEIMYENVSYIYNKNQYYCVYVNYIMFMFGIEEDIINVKNNAELVIENTLKYKFYSLLKLNEVYTIDVNGEIDNINYTLGGRGYIVYDKYKECVFHVFSNYSNMKDVKNLINFYTNNNIDFNSINKINDKNVKNKICNNHKDNKVYDLEDYDIKILL